MMAIFFHVFGVFRGLKNDLLMWFNLFASARTNLAILSLFFLHRGLRTVRFTKSVRIHPDIEC